MDSFSLLNSNYLAQVPPVGLLLGRRCRLWRLLLPKDIGERIDNGLLKV